MMKYEPYNFDSFKELVAYAYNLGWYGGRKTLFNLKCEGDFEGWSGRASETWEQNIHPSFSKSSFVGILYFLFFISNLFF